MTPFLVLLRKVTRPSPTPLRVFPPADLAFSSSCKRLVLTVAGPQTPPPASMPALKAVRHRRYSYISLSRSSSRNAHPSAIGGAYRRVLSLVEQTTAIGRFFLSFENLRLSPSSFFFYLWKRAPVLHALPPNFYVLRASFLMLPAPSFYSFFFVEPTPGAASGGIPLRMPALCLPSPFSFSRPTAPFIGASGIHLPICRVFPALFLHIPFQTTLPPRRTPSPLFQRHFPRPTL